MDDASNSRANYPVPILNSNDKYRTIGSRFRSKLSIRSRNKLILSLMHIYNHMDNFKGNVEPHNCDNISVFSFCIDTKTTKSGKSSHHHSMTTTSNNNSVNSPKIPSPIVDLSAMPDDILSMIDFFIGARDYDSQTTGNSSLLSNDMDATQTTYVGVTGVGHISKGVDLTDFKGTKNLSALRKHKIHKKSSGSKALLENRTQLKSAFLGLERAFGKFGGDRFTEWFRD